MIARLAAWIEARTGYRALAHAALDEPISGGARARYVFGSVLLFLIVNQVVTGTLLAMGYAPSVHDAWASVAYTQELAPAGWFIRGMHSAGASTAIVVLALHLLQVTWAGAYRKPRELTWWIGILLMLLLLAFGLTGYLLPWDQKGYFATQVATSLLGATPLVGPSAQEIVQGGVSYGNLTLTRFYALHVLVLPMLLAAFVGLHVLLFRKNGVTPPAHLDGVTLAKTTQAFHPTQTALDLGAAAACAAVLVVWVMRTHGASLEAPADPTSAYEARPEWYFMPLFQLLRHLPGSLEMVGALGVPAVALGVLVSLPFLDRSESRKPRTRLVPLLLAGGLVLGTIVLGATGFSEDARDASFRAGRQKAERAAEAARLRFVARLGGAPADAAAQRALGAAIFDDACTGCHVLGGHGESRAPGLDHWSNRKWLADFLRNPDDEHYFGKTELHDMKPVTAGAADLDALVEWVWSQGGEGGDAEKIARGAKLFEEMSCSDCHEKDGSSDGHGIPNLGGRGSADWLRGLLRDAGAPQYFDKKNRMPKFADKLSDVELDALIALLRAERLR